MRITPSVCRQGASCIASFRSQEDGNSGQFGLGRSFVERTLEYLDDAYK